MSDSLERVVIVSPPPAAPADHDQKMIDLVDGKAAEQAEATRPEWLPAKFKTVEEMAASYKELESKLGGAKPAPAPAATAPAAPAAPVEAEAAVTKAGLDMATLNTEFAKEGKLSDASMAALEAAGFDRSIVDNYIAGQQALAAQYDSTVMQATPGGADKYGEMVTWAKANLSDAEIAAYNNAVGSRNVEQAKLAVAGLGARFAAAVGAEPKLQGGRTNATSADVFESLAQMKVAMSDPRYKNDPAFRKTVQEKLGRSSIM